MNVSASSLLDQISRCQLLPTTIAALTPRSPRHERARQEFNFASNEIALAILKISELTGSYTQIYEDEERDILSFHKTRVATFNP